MSYGEFRKYFIARQCSVKNKSDSSTGSLSAIDKTPKKKVFGYSERGLPLVAYILGDTKAKKNFYMIGAMHGDEPATRKTANDFLEELPGIARKYFKGRRIIVIPAFNPDGLKLNTRKNARKTDLNRDYPTKDGEDDESDTRKNPAAAETRAFLKLMKKYPPAQVVSLHQPFRYVNFDGPAEELATVMGKLADYPVEPDMGYETPGSLGTYLGKERNIPIITFELPRWMRKNMFPYYYQEARYALLYAFFDCLPVSLR